MKEFYKALKSSCEEIADRLNPLFPLKFDICIDDNRRTLFLKISEGSIGNIIISDDKYDHRCNQPPCIMVSWVESKGNATIIADKIFEKQGRDSVQIKDLEERDSVAEQVSLFIKRLCIQHTTDIEYKIFRNKDRKHYIESDNISVEVWHNEDNYNVKVMQNRQLIGQRHFNKKDTNNPCFDGHININGITYSIRYTRDGGNDLIPSYTIKFHKEPILIPSGPNQMPSWYSIYTKKYNNNGGKQEDVRSTLEFNEKSWIHYLCDSSFQSSFVAAYNIVKNLLQNGTVKDKYKDLENISIADIGCGVGGATIGVISAIEELLPNVKKIEVEAFDYNTYALQIFEDSIMNPESGWKLFTDKQISFTSSVIKFVPIEKQKEDEYTFENFSEKIANKQYDFTLCFKMVNELICPQNNLGFDERAYYHICKIMNEHIKESGFAILFDIYKSAETNPRTRTNADTINYNDLLRNQTRIFIQENQDYRVIVPVPCGLAEDCKCTKCSTYKIIRPSGYNGREFPASYRVMTMRPFAEEILNGITLKNPTMYTVMYTKDHKKKKCCYKIDNYNIECPENEIIIDGLSIPNYGREDNNN